MSHNPIRNQKIPNLEKNFTSLNLRFDIVFWVLFIIVAFWSFYGEILAEPYYCPKDGQFAKTVRRLIIILLSLFFLLIIRASIWSPYGKSLAEPR